MQIMYNSKTDTLYLRLDDDKQDVINQRISNEIVFDLGMDEKIIGIEILEASLHTNLKTILPIEYQIEAGAKI